MNKLFPDFKSQIKYSWKMLSLVLGGEQGSSSMIFGVDCHRFPDARKCQIVLVQCQFQRLCDARVFPDLKSQIKYSWKISLPCSWWRTRKLKHDIWN